MKTNKELYEKYAGRQIRLENGIEGVVCGYDNRDIRIAPIIIALIKCHSTGWHIPRECMEIVTHKNNPLGYYWVDAPKKDSLWKRITKRFWGK